LLRTRLTAAAALALCLASPAFAQRAAENAVTAAVDGFGVTVGNERVGVYSPTSVRGFSPITAGNRRIEGLYFDLGGNGLTNRIVSRSTVRVGLPALAYPFPAPSGVVDYDLRVPGNEPVLSVVAQRPGYGGYGLEIDGQRPLLEGRLYLSAGVGFGETEYVDGRRTDAASVALIPTLRLERSEWTAFLSAARSGGDVPAILVTSGARLPPTVDTERFQGQSWIDNDQRSATYGLLGRMELSDDLTLRLGAFESRSTRRRTYSDLFLEVQPDGSAQSVVVSDPKLPARWTSGEGRLSWRFVGAGGEHTLHGVVRGRDKRLEIGGGASAALGPSRIGVLTPAPEPDFAYSPPSVNQVRQVSAGLAYLGRWENGIEANLGLQKSRYRSQITRAGRADDIEVAPWLYNATLAYAPVDWIGIYAGATRGLEESAGPPASALNRDEAVPASRTLQYDAGVRLAARRLRFVAGVFQIERPYYSIGPDGLYRPLGETRNRGVELSLTGPVTDRLTIVAGLVLMDPRVIGEAAASGRTGRRPVASTTRSGRLDLEYRVPRFEGFSLSLGLQHSGDIVASTTGYAALDGAQLKVPAATTVDLGARYRFVVAGAPASVRLQVLNVFDVRRPFVNASNAFTSPDTRRLSLQLAADF
jgi:iron complex outermembrane receptor protein